ncbi:rhodanese-like domain-containing protein [Deinococcus radiophilus]|uniref:Rhodanese-like domain-containing protein n=1 Tax=Deinococcus radiophilus TaxID=32062 RepID=A0A3S0I580_9DEIO|nr:rhodanese-like domain-containing protein [Deinococcus radiophilus]RTR25406.1 rhodanese-like domain-containing protein [Deinococcus radiophilus]
MTTFARFALPLLAFSLVACAPADGADTAPPTSTSPSSAAPTAQAPAAAGYQTVTVQALHERLGQDIHIIDVRTPEEFAAGHIEGAQLLPLGELEGRMAELPKDGELYVVCRSGSRSAQASELLTQAGRSVTNVDGGMLAWEAAGLPVVQ